MKWKTAAAVRLLLVAGLLFLAASLAACEGGNSSRSAGINEGSVAVDFSLPALDGAEASLSDYLGSVVLVNFWATWCPPCRAEIPDIEKAYQSRQADGLVVLGVAVEQARPLVEPFVEALGMSYPVLLDERGQVYRTYRAPGLPMSLILDRDGVIRARHVGFLSSEELDKYLAELLP